ncbi:hypothetical protein F5Y13DRAFT_199 [Hypoxylon sp. FL1857]|nr:hypothetical protein F5Y13DRAFT_199 [Hypoxylon sp. FL1857]
MTEGLEGVLQQLQSVLVQLNTVLENQDHPMKDVENDAKNDTGQKTSVEGSSQQLHRLLRDRIPTPNRLREIRNGLINLLQKGALHEDAPRPVELSGGTIYFRGHHHLGVTLQLRTGAIGIRTLVNMSNTNKQPFLKEIEENWPDNFNGWRFPRCGSPRIYSSDDWLLGKLYDSDPLGYPSNYECEDDSQSDLAPGRV